MPVQYQYLVLDRIWSRTRGKALKQRRDEDRVDEWPQSLGSRAGRVWGQRRGLSLVARDCTAKRKRERRREEGSEQMDGPRWRAAAPTECRGPVASEQLQRPAFCIGLGLQPMASIRACLMRLDSCPYSAANSRQMPHLGDAAPYECNYGLYLAWHLGLALLRGIIVGEQRQLATERQAGIWPVATLGRLLLNTTPTLLLCTPALAI